MAAHRNRREVTSRTADPSSVLAAKADRHFDRSRACSSASGLVEARTVFPILVVTFDDVFREGPLISTMILRPISKMFACPCYFRQVRVGPAIVVKKFFACEEPLETDTHVPNHV